MQLTGCSEGCQVTYDFALRAAADKFRDPQVAQEVDGAFISPPSSWLLRTRSQVGYRIETKLDAPSVFLSGLPPVKKFDSGIAEVTGAALGVAPFATLGPWRSRALKGHPEIVLAISPSRYAMTDEQLEQWIALTFGPMLEYYGKFVMPHVLVVIAPGNRGVAGVTLGNGGASVLLNVSPSVKGEQALAHWVPTHELVHVLFPHAQIIKG